MMRLNELMKELNIPNHYIGKLKKRLTQTGIDISNDGNITETDALKVIEQYNNLTNLSLFISDLLPCDICDAQKRSLLYMTIQGIKKNKDIKIIRASETYFEYKTLDSYFYKTDKRKVETEARIIISSQYEYNDGKLVSVQVINADYENAIERVSYWIKDGEISWQLRNNVLVIEKEEYVKLSNNGEALINIEKICIKDIRNSEIRKYFANLRDTYTFNNSFNNEIIIYREGKYYIKERDCDIFINSLKREIEEARNEKKSVSIYIAARQIGISVSIIKEKIESGFIEAEEVNGKLCISKNKIEEISSQKTKYTGLYTVVNDLLKHIQSEFKVEYISDRTQLIEYLELNDYFSLSYLEETAILFESSGKNEIYFLNTQLDDLTTNIKNYLWLFKLSEKEKYERLRTVVSQKAPITFKMYDSYIDKDNIGVAENNVTIILKYRLPKELYNMTTDEVTDLFAFTETYKAQLILVKFLNYIKVKKRTSYDTFVDNHVPVPRNREAYSMQQVTKLAVCIFNEKYISKHNLVRKALKDNISAESWLYLSLHYVCAWRSGDIVSNWPYINSENNFYKDISSEELENRILSGSIADEEYERITRTILARIITANNTPSKTKNISSKIIPPLQIEILPELMKHFGLLTLIAEVHYKRDGTGHMKAGSVNSYKNVYRLSTFIGDDIGKILGHKNFWSLSMNKSYLQALETITRNEGHSTMVSYMIASYARSHSFKNMKLPTSTATYLSGSQLTGESAAIVIYEMFQRGILGFVPYRLLLTCFPDVYNLLDLKSQTKLIQMMGINAGDIEIAMKGYEASDKLVEYVFSGKEDRAVSILRALHNIGSGYGVSKDKGCYCLLRALGYACNSPNMERCIGCPYDLITIEGIPAILDGIKFYADKYYKTNNEKYKVILNRVIKPNVINILNAYVHDLNEIEQKAIYKYIEELESKNV